MKSSPPAEVFTPADGIQAVYFAMPIEQELGLVIAMAVTLLGMVLHWQLPRQRISMEERMKDGKLTESQARTRLKIFHWCAPLVTFFGVVLLLGVMLAFRE